MIDHKKLCELRDKAQRTNGWIAGQLQVSESYVSKTMAGERKAPTLRALIEELLKPRRKRA